MKNTQNIQGNRFDMRILKRIIRLSFPYKKKLLLSCLLSIIIALIVPCKPILSRIIVDNYILLKNYTGLQWMGALLLGLLLIETCIRYFFLYTSRILAQSVIHDLRIKIFKHIARFKMTYFDRTPIGVSTTRTINDVEVLNDVFTQGLVSILADVLMVLGIILTMLYTDWAIALVSLSVLPLFLYATYQFKEGIKKGFHIERQKLAELNTFLQEHISGMKIIQLFHIEQQEMKKFKHINKAYRQAHMRTIWYNSIFFPFVEIMSALSTSLMVWMAATYILKTDKIEPGIIFTFSYCLNMLYRPLRMLADKFNTLQRGVTASKRLFAVLDEKATIEDKGKYAPIKVHGDILFKHVYFSYSNPPSPYILKDLSFDIKAGETTAIVGATGAGKSSIINILTRLYDIQKGSIQIDHTPIYDYPLSYLRKHIRVVLQDVFLFSGSIMDNITLKDASISPESVYNASKLLGAHKFISALPQGYAYQVMERGHTLSVGQRQIISFIRALVANPSILVLDEATSSIDSKSEQIIQTATNRLIKNRTAIIIAHRLSTIRHADKIIVLDKGEIKEIGNHTGLLLKNGYYARLHKKQFSSA